ncbi:MAG: 30S ribosomal protein S20 [Firmicutes bacterium]|nr:30S ribosomal protein S20 [Bacillota bacterium]
MPNIKSAKKRVIVSEKKNLRNRMYKSALHTSIRKYTAALEAGDKEKAQELYRSTVKKIDQGVSKGIIHKNTAARKKSQFTKALAKLA